MESPILVGGDTLGFNGVFADKRAWYLAASNVRALANKAQGVVVFFYKRHLVVLLRAHVRK